jgi:8-oxo-dGTP pyrophosphatase MutT (NUDIX family)
MSSDWPSTVLAPWLADGGSATSRYRGRHVEVFEITNGARTFEVVVRSPGVRGIVIRDGSILMTRERRHELGTEIEDWRLPGGKVFDSGDAFRAFCALPGDLAAEKRSAVVRELREEAGVICGAADLQHVANSPAGSMIVWDLDYYRIERFTEAPPAPEVGEAIQPEWVTFARLRALLNDHAVREDRTAGVLYRLLASVAG